MFIRYRGQEMIKTSLLFILLLLIPLSGCLGQQDQNTETPRLEKAKTIQSNFEDEYLLLNQAIMEEDLKAAKEHYDNLYGVYQEAKETASEGHMGFVVKEESLTVLKRQIEANDFRGANGTLSSIPKGCGVSVCHARSGGKMVDLEREYSIIKNSLDMGDMETAKEHYPAFERNFYESKEYVSGFLPKLSEERMKEEYVTELKDSLDSGDLNRSRDAIYVISNKTCSLSGCHKIFLTK
jgi:hypothetical protein